MSINKQVIYGGLSLLSLLIALAAIAAPGPFVGPWVSPWLSLAVFGGFFMMLVFGMLALYPRMRRYQRALNKALEMVDKEQ